MHPRIVVALFPQNLNHSVRIVANQRIDTHIGKALDVLVFVDRPGVDLTAGVMHFFHRFFRKEAENRVTALHVVCLCILSVIYQSAFRQEASFDSRIDFFAS